jgi:DedD protein
MSDQQFREIQLSGKQLVFLFMASVVLAVSVFLLGVSVGRGVREVDGSTPVRNDGASGPGLVPPDVMPVPTEISERDSAFEQLLPGESGPRPVGVDEAPPATPPREPPPVVNEPVETALPAASAPAPARPAPPAASAPVARPAPTPASPAGRSGSEDAPPRTTPAGQFTVQVNAYRSRASADREAAALAEKGYDAYVDASSNGLFRVRIGAFANRDDANRIAARLREDGISSLVTR